MVHRRLYEGRLLCVAGPDAGRAFHLEGTPALIGRDSRAQIQLRSDHVSRCHARIVRDGPALVLEDLSSLNGLRVNGGSTLVHRLESGDQIQIGETLLVYVSPDGASRRITQFQLDEDTGHW